VRVAKYIKAPTIEAKKFALIELPPTSVATKREGIKPSSPGLPKRRPAKNIPKKSKGNICWVKLQEDSS